MVITKLDILFFIYRLKKERDKDKGVPEEYAVPVPLMMYVIDKQVYEGGNIK